MCSVIARTLLVSVLLVLAAAQPLLVSAQAPSSSTYQVPTSIRLCYLLFGGVDDLGYTFSFNVARLRIHENIEAAFPNSTVTSVAVQNVYFMPAAAKRAALAEFVRDGCNIVAANSQTLLHGGNYSEVSAMYPNVTFFTLPHSYDQLLSGLPNVAFMVQIPREAFYRKGAAAAQQASTCVGIITAFERPGNAMDAVNGALRGIRDENPTIPIHVLTMNSWYWPDGEADAARLMMRLGCEVVMHYTDPRVIDLTVANEAPGPGFFSVGVYSDLQQYVGDSVLVSSYIAWDVGLTPLFTQVLRDGTLDVSGAPFIFGRGVTLTTKLSPRSAEAARDAFDRANARVLASPNVLCGNLRLRNGSTLAATAPGGCLALTTQTALFLDSTATTFHGSFRYRSECPAGTFAQYAVSPVISLSCTTCPENTYSSAAGSTECTPCPNGTVAAPGSIVCTQVAESAAEESNLPTWAIPVIAVGSVFVCVIAVGVTAALSRRRRAANHDAAPKKPPLCILFTDIESSTELWQAHDRMGEAVDIHHRVIRELLLEYGGYEVKTVGDSFMIAVAGVVDAVMIAVAIQRRLQQAEWPAGFGADEQGADPLFNGLKVRIGVHYCEEVEPKYEAERDYWDYYGPDVNVAARVEAQARGGQILLSTSTVAALQVDELYEPIVAPDVSMYVFARGVRLKGVHVPVTLYSVTPIELAGRRFQPLEGYEGDRDTLKLEVSSVHSSMDVAGLADGGAGAGAGGNSVQEEPLGAALPTGRLTQRMVLTVLQRTLSKAPLQDRITMADIMVRTWDRQAQTKPVALQLRAASAAIAATFASAAKSALQSGSPTPRSCHFTPVCTPHTQHVALASST